MNPNDTINNDIPVLGYVDIESQQTTDYPVSPTAAAVEDIAQQGRGLVRNDSFSKLLESLHSEGADASGEALVNKLVELEGAGKKRSAKEESVASLKKRALSPPPELGVPKVSDQLVDTFRRLMAHDEKLKADLMAKALPQPPTLGWIEPPQPKDNSTPREQS